MNKIFKLYRKLLKKHGRPRGQWTLWRKRPKTTSEKEEVIIGAILTQRTNWRNVEAALANLKKTGVCSIRDIYKLGGKDKLASLVKPAGFYKQKAGYLFGLAKFIVERYGDVSRMAKEPFPKLRQELLALKGIGPETADSILLYALEKSVFVIDEYTRRLIKDKRISQEKNYEKLRRLFEKNLRRDFRLYQDFHALIVIDGKHPTI